MVCPPRRPAVPLAATSRACSRTASMPSCTRPLIRASARATTLSSRRTTTRSRRRSRAPRATLPGTRWADRGTRPALTATRRSATARRRTRAPTSGRRRRDSLYYNQDRGGCSDWSDGRAVSSGCHDIGNVATLHIESVGQGLPPVPLVRARPRRTSATTATSSARRRHDAARHRVYHHLNEKYLNNPAEVRSPGDKYFLMQNASTRAAGSATATCRVERSGRQAGFEGDFGPPASSWDMTRYDYDCAASCHSGTAIGVGTRSPSSAAQARRATSSAVRSPRRSGTAAAPRAVTGCR